MSMSMYRFKTFPPFLASKCSISVTGSHTVTASLASQPRDWNKMDLHRATQLPRFFVLPGGQSEGFSQEQFPPDSRL